MKAITISVLVLSGMLSGTGLAATNILLTADDFQTNIVDALLPKAAVAGTHGAYAYGTGAGEVFVKADPLDATNKVVRVYKDAATGGSYLYASALSGAVKTFDQLTADRQKMVFSYDVYVNSANRNHFYVQLQYTSGNALGTVYYKIPSGGNTALDTLVAGGTQTASGVSVAADAWHTVTYDIHKLPNGNWALTIVVVRKSTGVSTTILENATATLSGTDATTFYRLSFYQYGQVTGESFSYIDNIALHYVPLPPLTGTVFSLR